MGGFERYYQAIDAGREAEAFERRMIEQEFETALTAKIYRCRYFSHPDEADISE
jgi:hypothetical protein